MMNLLMLFIQADNKIEKLYIVKYNGIRVDPYIIKKALENKKSLINQDDWGFNDAYTPNIWNWFYKNNAKYEAFLKSSNWNFFHDKAELYNYNGADFIQLNVNNSSWRI